MFAEGVSSILRACLEKLQQNPKKRKQDERNMGENSEKTRLTYDSWLMKEAVLKILGLISDDLIEAGAGEQLLSIVTAEVRSGAEISENFLGIFGKIQIRQTSTVSLEFMR